MASSGFRGLIGDCTTARVWLPPCGGHSGATARTCTAFREPSSGRLSVGPRFRASQCDNAPVTRMVAALDVGGTTVKAALLDEQLEPQATLRAETARSADGTALAEQVAEIVTRLSEQAGTGAPAAVGVVVPGIVDEKTRICHFSANLDWREVHFGELLEARLGLPVAFGHDVTAGGIAEFRVGAGLGCENA